MKLLQITEPGHAAWIDADQPTPASDEVLLKVTGITTCPQWDLHILGGEPMFADRPLSYPYVPGEPGHEAVGEVAEVGSEVTSLTVGQRVATWRDPGGRRQGCYAQYVPIQADDLLPVPTSLSDEALASLELAMCVQVSFDQLQGRGGIQGKRVGISGLGPAGLIAVQMARAYGAREVIAFDLLADRRNLALLIGADAVYAPEAFIADRTMANAFDVGLDTTGLKVAIEQLMTRTRETVAIFGVLREDIVFGPMYWWGDFALLGYGAHNRDAAERALQLIHKGRLDLTSLITHRLAFTYYEEGINLLRSKSAIKVFFDPWA